MLDKIESAHSLGKEKLLSKNREFFQKMIEPHLSTLKENILNEIFNNPSASIWIRYCSIDNGFPPPNMPSLDDMNFILLEYSEENEKFSIKFDLRDDIDYDPDGISYELNLFCEVRRVKK